MATLNDLLVTYKRVKAPVIDTVPQIEDANTKYHQMLAYLAERQKKKSEQSTSTTKQSTTPTKQPTVKWEWTYSGGSSQSPTQRRPIAYSKDNWISNMMAAYRNAGISGDSIRYLIAKNALESNYGTAVIGDYNYGNITKGSSWTGETKKMDINGQQVQFRSYANLDDYIKDELSLLRRLYDFKASDDIDTFLRKLQGRNQGRYQYAEDSKYIQKVKETYNSIKWPSE